MRARSELLEQALVDAEVLRAQAELTCAESQTTYDAAKQALVASQKVLVAATRTTDALRKVITLDVGEG